jgi:hypothetical protein
MGIFEVTQVVVWHVEAPDSAAAVEISKAIEPTTEYSREVRKVGAK